MFERVVLIKLEDNAPAPRDVASETRRAFANESAKVTLPCDPESIRSWDLRLVVELSSLEADALLMRSASWLTWRQSLPAIVVKTWVFASST